MCFAYTLTNTTNLEAYFRVRDPGNLIHIGIEFNNYLEVFFSNYDTKETESAGNIP